MSSMHVVMTHFIVYYFIHCAMKKCHARKCERARHTKRARNLFSEIFIFIDGISLGGAGKRICFIFTRCIVLAALLRGIRCASIRNVRLNGYCTLAGSVAWRINTINAITVRKIRMQTKAAQYLQQSKA